MDVQSKESKSGLAGLMPFLKRLRLCSLEARRVVENVSLPERAAKSSEECLVCLVMAERSKNKCRVTTKNSFRFSPQHHLGLLKVFPSVPFAVFQYPLR